MTDSPLDKLHSDETHRGEPEIDSPEFFRNNMRKWWMAMEASHEMLMAGRVPVVSCEDLIIQKLYAERLIDRADVLTLLEIRSKQLDLDYLEEWIGKFDLQSTWQDILNRTTQ